MKIGVFGVGGVGGFFGAWLAGIAIDRTGSYNWMW